MVTAILTAILTIVFAMLLLYLRLHLVYIIAISLGMGVFLAYFSTHTHTKSLSIDIMAQTSRLKETDPKLKFWTLFALLIVCIASKSVFTGLFLVLLMMLLSVKVGGLDLHHYMSVLVVPIRFLLVGGLALLLEVSTEPVGIWNLPILGSWLCLTEKAQISTSLTISRAFGAISCLCLLSTTTPMPDIIGVLRRAKCPDIVIDLMYLVYRYIFILISVHQDMYNAAKSRLGLHDYRTSMRTTAKIYSSLLVRSFNFAGKNFDAMESRCYDTGIAFLQQEYEITIAEKCVSAGLILGAIAISILTPRLNLTISRGL